MNWTKKKLGMLLASVAAIGIGAGALIISQLPEDIPEDNPSIVMTPPGGPGLTPEFPFTLPGDPGALPEIPFTLPDNPAGPFAGPGMLDDLLRGAMPPSDPTCKPPQEVADHFKKAGYKGLAYGALGDRNFYLLTGKDGKWAYIVPDEATGTLACVPHEGKGFRTARPTGVLQLASAPTYPRVPTLQPAAYVRATHNGEPAPVDENLCGETDKLLSWMNSARGLSTVFRGSEGKGKTLRILADNSDVNATFAVLASSEPGKSCIADAGDNFRFAEGYKPPFQSLK